MIKLKIYLGKNILEKLDKLMCKLVPITPVRDTAIVLNTLDEIMRFIYIYG